MITNNKYLVIGGQQTLHKNKMLKVDFFKLLKFSWLSD